MDAVRLPVYLYHSGGELLEYGWLVALAIAGVLAGTLYGERVLRKLPERRFRQIVSVFLVVLGVSLLAAAPYLGRE